MMGSSLWQLSAVILHPIFRCLFPGGWIGTVGPLGAPPLDDPCAEMETWDTKGAAYGVRHLAHVGNGSWHLIPCSVAGYPRKV